MFIELNKQDAREVFFALHFTAERATEAASYNLRTIAETFRPALDPKEQQPPVLK